MTAAERIGTDALSLREPTLQDLPAFFEFQCDPVAIRMSGFRPRSQEAFMSHWQGVLEDAGVAKYTIVWERQVAGNLVFFDMGGRRAVGYWLGRDYWGRGLATRALELALSSESQRPLFASVAAHNTASVRVLEKCGFVLVGTAIPPPGARPLDGDELLMRLSAGEAQTKVL